MLICTDHAVVIDCCQAFSFQGWVVPRTAFNVAAPYFRARQDEGQAKKKRKTEPSVAELQTEQHHESIRTLLQTVLDEVQSVWSRVTVETSDRQDEPAVDPINFPALQSLVQASQRFSNIPDVDGDSEATICSLKDPVTEWDTLSVFNRIITNPSKDTRSLTLSPTARYLIPPQASFLMSDMEDMYPLTEYGIISMIRSVI
ncbi:uncharacterized protein BYT42DRAFT_187779 [Radiomyces spectabilis]|uniref:uncharacterized protein n=1 Tax=Radiomyces spectabilis TaxID=64574 RepID=UPI00221E6483|nr:uncharacterized protein BYT42DRAFT_187779 [Radiomyces spectabilis]KAI8391260.1 hypothetical protein BYT42DRAFT_187779 [Radiomyces spectabilis]